MSTSTAIRLFGVWLATVLSFICWTQGASAAPAATGDVHRLDRAELRLGGSVLAPPSDVAVERVELPDAWRRLRPGAAGLGWYRFDVPRPTDPKRRWALYLPAVNMTADAYVNGQAVGSGGPLEPAARNFSTPLYFVFPGSLLDRDQNQVELVLAAVAHNYPSLAPVWIGPDEELAPHFERDHFWRSTLPWFETFLALGMAGLMLALWRSSRDHVYGTFSLVSVLYAVFSLNYWVHEPPLPFWTWERLLQLALFDFAVMLAVWSRFFVGLSNVRPLRALLALAAMGSLAILLIPVPWFLPVVQRLHLVTFAVAAYACVSTVVRLRRSRSEFWLFAPFASMGLVIGAHDIAINLGWLSPESTYLMPHQVPLFVFTFGVSLVRRFTRSLREAEALSRVLEQRVEEKRREIEESYRTQRALEHERLLAAERDRMIREMHDGLGSQLTATLALIERGRGDPTRLANALRGALDEMRLVINSLDSEPRQIPEVLGVLRPRLLPILEGQGITLSWQVDDGSEQRSFGAEESLHVLRIVQEAIGNTLKHGRASRIVVEARQTETSLLVSVTDDGAGFSQDNVKQGRGLAHMRERAAALKGRLQVVHNTPGTTILLELPRVLALH